MGSSEGVCEANRATPWSRRSSGAKTELETRFRFRIGFGFSNNVMGSMGPPTFERAQFDLASDQKDLDIDIKMKYM